MPERLYKGLTRPAMFMGVPYPLALGMITVFPALFLMTKDILGGKAIFIWLAAVPYWFIARWIGENNPNFADIFTVKMQYFGKQRKLIRFYGNNVKTYDPN